MDDTMHAAGGATALATLPTAGATEKTILLLDSAPVFLRFEETILQRRDWRVLRATTGAEALDVLSRERVDLLVMDHELPDLLGEHVIRAIRSSPEMRSMAVLIVTARSEQGSVERCMSEGCNGFLYKPVSRQALTAKVEQLLAVQARRHVRTLVRLQVEDGSGRRAFFGNTVNLSAGGMLVESPTELGVGEQMDLRFHLPGDSAPVVVVARVVRPVVSEDTGQTAWGLEFERLDDEDRRRIEGFVRASEVSASGCAEERS